MHGEEDPEGDRLERTHERSQELLREVAPKCEKICRENQFDDSEFAAFFISQLLTAIIIVEEKHKGPEGPVDFLMKVSAATSSYLKQRGHNKVIQVSIAEEEEGS